MMFAGCRLEVAGLIVFLFFTQAGCYAQHQENLTAKATEITDSYLWDFGKIKEGVVAKHIFILKNESAKELKIIQVNTSCGCTVSKVKKNILKPGESADIEVKFNSKKYSGPIQQFIYVNTDNIDNSVIRFIIKAEVIK
jgi:hypothetical protein